MKTQEFTYFLLSLTDSSMLNEFLKKNKKKTSTEFHVILYVDIVPSEQPWSPHRGSRLALMSRR